MTDEEQKVIAYAAELDRRANAFIAKMAEKEVRFEPVVDAFWKMTGPLTQDSLAVYTALCILLGQVIALVEDKAMRIDMQAAAQRMINTSIKAAAEEYEAAGLYRRN